MRDKRLVARVAQHLKRSEHDVEAHLNSLLEQLGSIFDDNNDAFKALKEQLYKDMKNAYKTMYFLVEHENAEVFKILEHD